VGRQSAEERDGVDCWWPYCGTVRTQDLLLWVEREWAAIEKRQFGIGNICMADGQSTDEHHSHKDGLQVDVRPLRTEGAHRPVTWLQSEYDGEATAKLIAIFLSYPLVKQVLFNDNRIPGVRHWPRHDDHFHVGIKPGQK
jgi:murein endopeptidase